jgi:hypothetical protein
MYWLAALSLVWRSIDYFDESGVRGILESETHLFRMLLASAAMLLSAGYFVATGRPKTGAIVGTLAGLSVALFMAPMIY